MTNNKDKKQIESNNKPVGINDQAEKTKENNQLKSSHNEHKSSSSSGDSLSNVDGIFIYEQAKKKLNISNDGKIYRQKFFNYLPFVSIISVLIYVNFVFGKTKCLNDDDHALFKRAHFWTNIVGFLIMPIVAMALWTFGTWIAYDIIPGASTNYSGLWNQYYNTIVSSSTILDGIANAIGGLFQIAIAPLVVPTTLLPNLAGSLPIINGVVIPPNILFILSLVLFTIINPVNIIFTFIMNSRILRFVTVSESSSIYRYRK